MTIKSNDPEQQQDITLQMILTAQPYVDVLPNTMVYVELYEGDELSKDLTIISNEAPPFEVTKVEPKADYIATNLTPLPATEEGKPQQYKLTITTKPTLKAGNFSTIIIVHSNSKKEPQTYITFMGFAKKDISVEPRNLQFNLVPAGQTSPIEKTLLLKKRSGPFAITKVEHEEQITLFPQTPQPGQAGTVQQPGPIKGPAKALKFEWAPSGPQKQQYNLKVTYLGGWQSGLVQGEIKVLTDDPKQPEVVIPLFATVQKLPQQPQAAQ